MQIDFNPTECAAMEAFKNCQRDKGRQLQGQFIAEIKELRKNGGDHCSCPEECDLHGNCLMCVQVHRGHGDHLPHCLQCMVNKKLAAISELTEHSIVKEVKRPAYFNEEN